MIILSRFFILLVRLRFFCLLKSDRELIGTGGRSRTAVDATKTLNGFVYGHSLNKSAYSLSISRATARERYVFNDTVFQIDVDLAGANSVGLVSVVFHKFVLPFYVIQLYLHI